MLDGKNSYIYTRPLLLEYGLWDQVRVDQGKEWVLMLFVQEQLADMRRDTSKAPHRQTTSKVGMYQQTTIFYAGMHLQISVS